jgi:hypothetical protein
MGNVLLLLSGLVVQQVQQHTFDDQRELLTAHKGLGCSICCFSLASASMGEIGR